VGYGSGGPGGDFYGTIALIKSPSGAVKSEGAGPRSRVEPFPECIGWQLLKMFDGGVYGARQNSWALNTFRNKS
jgi:hypothetical protein